MSTADLQELREVGSRVSSQKCDGRRSVENGSSAGRKNEPGSDTPPSADHFRRCRTARSRTARRRGRSSGSRCSPVERAVVAPLRLRTNTKLGSAPGRNTLPVTVPSSRFIETPSARAPTSFADEHLLAVGRGGECRRALRRARGRTPRGRPSRRRRESGESGRIVTGSRDDTMRERTVASPIWRRTLRSQGCGAVYTGRARRARDRAQRVVPASPAVFRTYRRHERTNISFRS